MKPEEIVYNRLCHEFTLLCKAMPSILPKHIPGAQEIIEAIKVLEKIYPELDPPQPSSNS